MFLERPCGAVVLNATVLTMLSPAATLGRSPGGGMSLALKSRVDGKLNDFLRALGNGVPAAMPSSIFAAAPAGLAPYPPHMRLMALVLQGEGLRVDRVDRVRYEHFGAAEYVSPRTNDRVFLCPSKEAVICHRFVVTCSSVTTPRQIIKGKMMNKARVSDE